MKALALLLLLAGAATLAAQDASPAKPPRIYRDQIIPHWLAHRPAFWYRNELPGNTSEFLLVDAEAGARLPAFDATRLTLAFERDTTERFEQGRWPFQTLEFPTNSATLRLLATNGGWELDLDSYKLVPIPATNSSSGPTNSSAPERERRAPRRPDRTASSPDRRHLAFVRGDNLWLRSTEPAADHPLTHDANPTATFADTGHRARLVEMRYTAADPEPPVPEVYWSPDSRFLVAMQTRLGAERHVRLVESSPTNQLQPRSHSYPYLKPGDDIPVSFPRLFDAQTRREIPVARELFPNPWSIDSVRWSPDSSGFTFLYNQRGHQILRIVHVDAATGRSRPVVDETSDTFVCYSQKFFAEHLPKTGELIWMSERDGWNHLYLYDTRTGSVKNQITHGQWVVRRVERVDAERRQIWFVAGGLHPDQDPYHLHLARVNFDGTGVTPLTSGDGSHTLQFSPNRRFFIDTWSRVDLPPRVELRRAEDGSLVCTLEEADTHELTELDWQPPLRFVTKGRDGTTDIYGIIHRPRPFDPARKYPIIESIYAGPHDSFVPKTFRASYRHDAFTRRGFAVVQIDGMGTSNRSKRFHDVCWKNLADAGFPDRILWIQAAAAAHPYLDTRRVGVFGGSAGGQNALGALLLHGDFYKAAAADCGCHDNRMDKIWWNEQWMGWPVGPHYAEQSNVTLAHKLQGKLFLTVGELDRNVDPASTLQVVDALIKANKDFEFLLVPGAGHGVAETPYVSRRRLEFFVRHLGNP